MEFRDKVVMVGTAAASVIFNNSTTLTAVTPANAPGAVTVTVSNLNGSGSLAAAL